MLGNFKYSNPTKIYFGKDSLIELGNEIKKYEVNILLVYGKGSIKTNGLYDKIVKIVTECDKNIFELSNVMPNPTLKKLYEGCEVIRKNKIDFILAIGGGSVCDYAKALSVSAYCENPWEKYFINQEKVDNKIIPIGCVLTMSGTGSEMNGGSVITNEDKKLKVSTEFDERVFPKFSILNPEYTMTVPRYQMVSGIFDIMSHLLEQYFSGEDDNTSDYVIEGLLKSLINSSKIAIDFPNDYEARSNIMWTATLALNTLVEKGKDGDWMVHSIGQSIGAYTDAAHGMTLSAISIPYYNHLLNYGLKKFKRYAINVWNVDDKNKSDLEIAKEGLYEMEKFMKNLGLVMNVKDLGVNEDMIEGIVDGTFILNGGYKTLNREEISEILEESMMYF